MSDGNKMILQRVNYLSNLNKTVAFKVKETYLNEKSQKKMFFPNIFMNSEEFKDLGTMHFERRHTDYHEKQNEDAQ